MSKRFHLFRRWWWIPATVLLVIAGLKLGRFLAPPKTPEIHLHPGGKLTLGTRDGREVRSADLLSWKPSEMPGPHVILDTPPGTTIDAWDPVLMVLSERGFGNYQVRLGERTLNCHLPGGYCAERRDRRNPAEIVDLRRRKDAPDPAEQSGYDVQVLVDRSTTWDDVFMQASVHFRAGVSMMIDMDGARFLRERDEDERHRREKGR